LINSHWSENKAHLA